MTGGLTTKVLPTIEWAGWVGALERWNVRTLKRATTFQYGLVKPEHLCYNKSKTWRGYNRPRQFLIAAMPIPMRSASSLSLRSFAISHSPWPLALRTHPAPPNCVALKKISIQFNSPPPPSIASPAAVCSERGYNGALLRSKAALLSILERWST
jgi:hypothetical protein